MHRRLALLMLAAFVCQMLAPHRLSVAAPRAPAIDDGQTDQIIVQLRPSADITPQSGIVVRESRLRSLSSVAGVSLDYARIMSGGAHVLRLPRAVPLAEAWKMAARLQAAPDVLMAEPDRPMRALREPTDPRFSEQWHLRSASASSYGANLPAAWDITTGSPDLVVAVLDTGILWTHPDLAGRLLAGYDFISNVSTANDGDGRDANPADPGDWYTSGQCGGSGSDDSSWHGSHVAGTIGASANNGAGVTGINWGSKILPVRVLGRCGGSVSDIVDAMRWSAGLTVPGVPANPSPARVLNLSLGASGSCGVVQSAVDDVVAAGAVVVVAAGNSAQDASGFSPASCQAVVTVGAIGPTGARAYYSNFGSTVEISAPGGDMSLGTTSGVLSTINSGTREPGAHSYGWYQGTSMAAPHIAGVVSLMLSANPGLLPERVLDILQRSARSFPSGSGCGPSQCGAGIVDAAAAVRAATLPALRQVSARWDEVSGDGDAVVDPGEIIELSADVLNYGGSVASGMNGVLTVSSGSARVLQGTSVYANIAPGSTASPAAPYRATIQDDQPCGSPVVFRQTVTFGGGQPFADTIVVPVGRAWVGDPQSIAYTGAPGAIADNTTTTLPLAVAEAGKVGDVDVSVTLNHTYDSDLTLELVSPAGTVVLLADQRGGSGDNYSNTVFDDEAGIAIGEGVAPFTGRYRPEWPLSALDGELASGVWSLRVTDRWQHDIGAITAFSLALST
ncbi:MAG: hypothetical protein RLZZ387_2513, partial [Chloroflexota bacterium]